MKILAVIPANNEAGGITPVIQGTRAHLPVLVVDDGSRDATSQVSRDAGAEVLRQEPNQGKGQALKTGFRRAIDLGYDAILTLDADGQHDPAEIPAFLERFSSGRGDLIIGARDYRQMPIVRRCSNTVGRWTFSWAIGQWIPDNQSGYRLVSRPLAEASLASPTGGFEFEVDIIVICVKNGFKLDWVPIRTIYAGENSHITPVRHVKRFFSMVWHTHQVMRAERQGRT